MSATPQVGAAHCTFFPCFRNVIDSLQGICQVALKFVTTYVVTLFIVQLANVREYILLHDIVHIYCILCNPVCLWTPIHHHVRPGWLYTQQSTHHFD